MGNTHNSGMNLPTPDKSNMKYHKWIDDIYKEIRYVYLKTNQHHINVLTLLDTFLEKFRQYIQTKHGYSTRMHDYQLVRETNRLMFLIRDLFCERNDQHYLMKTSEILGGCTFLWLRCHSLEDEQYNEIHIEKILNCYAIYLQSTTDESFLLKIITHTLYVCNKLPRIFYKILEMHLKRRVQRKGRRNIEAKEDQLYILYIIAFKLWDRLQPDGEDKINIAQYANSYMKPMNSLLSNPRYAPNLPKITTEDVKCGRATKIVINNLLPSKLLELAEAAVKEDWLKRSDINEPITVDLSIDDDVNRNERGVDNGGAFISVNPEITNLSFDEKHSNLSRELCWMKVLENKTQTNMNMSRKEVYRVVEVIDLDDEDGNSKTSIEMEFQNQYTATQSKEVDNAKKAGQKQISNEINIKTNRQEPQTNKEKNSNSGENISRRGDTTQEKGDNCTAIMVDKHALEGSALRGEVNSYNNFTASTEKKIDVDVKPERKNTQQPRNELESIDERTTSLPKNVIDFEKGQMVYNEQETQIIQVDSMETDSIVEETSEISESEEFQLEKQQTEQPMMVKVDRSKSFLRENPTYYHETCSEFELIDTSVEVTSKKGSHNVFPAEERCDVYAVSKDLNELELQNKEKANVKNSRPTENITLMVKDGIEFSEEASVDEVTSIVCIEESNSKSPIAVSESDDSTNVLGLNKEDKNDDCRTKSKSCSLLKSVGESGLKHMSDYPIDLIYQKSIHIIDEALNSSVESLQINNSPDDERVVEDAISISTIVEGSENYNAVNTKVDDIDIKKINPVVNVKSSKHKKNTSDRSILSTVSTNRNVSLSRKEIKQKSPQKDRVVCTSTENTKLRNESPNYSFRKSDPDEFHRHEKEVRTKSNRQTVHKNEHTVENLISKETNHVTKRRILTKTDDKIQYENLSACTVKQKPVSFAAVTQDKAPLVFNHRANSDSTIIERIQYDNHLTIQNKPQNWRSPINNSPSLSNQQNRKSQEQELLSMNDITNPGSSSPSPMKGSGMNQNVFQFERNKQLSILNDDAVGNNTEVLPNKSCESDNLAAATDLSISNNTIKVKTDLMNSDSELNNAEEDSINMIWELLTENCDNKSDEKELQNYLPLKKRRKHSQDGSSLAEVNCKKRSNKKAFDYYDKHIAYPAERCMSILQFLDISECQTTFFVNNNSSIAIINNSPSQQTILTGGGGLNMIAQQQKDSSTTMNTQIYPNIPVERDVNKNIDVNHSKRPIHPVMSTENAYYAVNDFIASNMSEDIEATNKGNRDEKHSNLSKELCWMEVMENKALRNMNMSKKEMYRVIEVIDLDDEDGNSKTSIEMDFQNQYAATQSKEVDNAKKAGQKQISNEIKIKTNRQEPQTNKEKNSNSGENISRRGDTTQEKGDNCTAIMVDKHALEGSALRDEVNSYNNFTASTEKEIDVDVKPERKNTQQPRNELESIDERTTSLPKKVIDFEKGQMVYNEHETQIIQVDSMETDSIVEETSEISESEEFQLEKQQTEQPMMVKVDRSKSFLRENPTYYHETCSEFELIDTSVEVTSKKGSHNVFPAEERCDVYAVSKDLNELELQNKEKTNVKNSRPTENITLMVKDGIEFSEEASVDEVTSIVCIEESNSKSPIAISESDDSTNVLGLNKEDKNDDCRTKSKSCSLLKSVGESGLKHMSDYPIDLIYQKSIHIIDEALNSSVESLQINNSPDDERVVEDAISISTIVEGSENYNAVDTKVDDIHIKKINPGVNVKSSKHKKNTSDRSILSTVSTNRNVSLSRKEIKQKSPQKDRVVCTSTENTKLRNESPNYSFRKSDPDEFHRHEKEVRTKSNRQTVHKNEHTVENLISKETNHVTKRRILTKTDDKIQYENLSACTVKQKPVSFAAVTQDKAPLVFNHRANSDSTIIERIQYDNHLTIQNKPQNWISPINNSPSLSNQQNRKSQQQELLSMNDITNPGSSSPSPMKGSGMNQNVFQFETNKQLSIFNDDAVGNNTEVLANKSCESDNLAAATDLSISSNTIKVKTDLMNSDSELNNAEEDSINMIWELITENCDNKPDEKKLQNSLPLKKRRKHSRDGNSFVEINCKESSDKKAFDYYDKQIAYPAERCMSILQFLDTLNAKQHVFVNNNPSIPIINNSPSQQTILTGGDGLNMIAQQQKDSSTTTNTQIYPNIPVERDVNKNIDVNHSKRPIHPVMSTENAYYAVNDFIASNMSEDIEATNKGNRDDVASLNKNQTPNSMNGNILQYENQNRIEIQKNERPNSSLNYQGREIPESKGPNLKLATEFASVEEDQKLARQQLHAVNMDHCNLKYEHISNYFHKNQINFAKTRAKKSRNNLTERITRSSNRTLSVNYKDDGLAERKSFKRRRKDV